MDKNRLNGFEEILNYCGYKKCNNNSQAENNNCNNNGNSNSNGNENEGTKTTIRFDPTAGASTNQCRNANLDLLFGFQDADPMFLVVIGEIVSNIISGKIPVNVAGAFGNWLQLIAQVITLFNAQQQYQQSGPGRYYNPIYRNASNPFCENTVDESGANTVGTSSRSSGKSSTTTSNDSNNKELQKRVESLENEIEKLKRKLDNIK